MHPNYAAFLNGLTFTEERLILDYARLSINLAKNNIPELALTLKQRNDYVHELLWTLADQNDITYLKSNLVDLWDREVQPESAVYGEYTAMERARLHGTPELVIEFINYIKQYTSELEVEGWTPETGSVIHDVDDESNTMVQRGEARVVRYLHPDIETKGHAWLDDRHIGGGPKELIFGELRRYAKPITLGGLKAFQQSNEPGRVIKVFPYPNVPEMSLLLTLTDIPREETIAAMLEARLAKDVDEADVVFDQFKDQFPTQHLAMTLNATGVLDLAQFDMYVFQAAVLAQIVANTLNTPPTTLTVAIQDLVVHKGAVEAKLHQLEREDLTASHLFFRTKGLDWNQYAFPMFEFM